MILFPQPFEKIFLRRKTHEIIHEKENKNRGKGEKEKRKLYVCHKF